MNFNDLSLSPSILRAIQDAGYKKPSPIQESSIPPVLAERDLLGCAQTGTGKTAAFALPILQLLSSREPVQKKAIRCLVLTPTRELALQIEESFSSYGKYLPLRHTVIFGGVGQSPQVAALKKGVDILVATPGRLNDLIGQGYIKLDHIEIFVLDEADRMLDMGFVHDVKKVLKLLPSKRQTLLFSATMPDEIIELADSLLVDPAKVFVTPVSSTVESIQQQLYKVDKTNKRHLLAELLGAPDITSALVFTRTKHGADRVVRELSRCNIKAMAIHGNKSQTARQNALSQFKAGKIKVLVATDIAARGLDISELSHVFNYDLPNIPETYVHRIGRTGRAGHGGTAISFCCFDELPYLADIQKLIGFALPEIAEHSYPMQVLQPSEKKTQPRPTKKEKKEPAPQRDKKEQHIKQPVTVKPAQTKPATSKQVSSALRTKPAGRRQTRQRPEINPYENRTGGSAIITKRPVWGDSTPVDTAPQSLSQKGEPSMARNNNRRRNKNKNPNNSTTPQPASPKKEEKPAKIRTNERGVFEFSDADLTEDTGLKVVSRNTGETKYASFEDFLKDQN